MQRKFGAKIENERYIIHDYGRYGGGITPDLRKNERQILYIKVKNCPRDDTCIYQSGVQSNICRYINAFPDNGVNIYDGADFKSCAFEFGVLYIMVAECPINLNDCLECDLLRKVIIPTMHPTRSHPCVECS
jgi:hypothetical protein